MKAILIAVLVFLIMFSTFAQEQVDTVAAQDLQEIVIQAPRVIRKADMDVYYPSQSAVENSKNGVQLLNNLMIPSLTVIDALAQFKPRASPYRCASTVGRPQLIRCVRCYRNLSSG